MSPLPNKLSNKLPTNLVAHASVDPLLSFCKASADALRLNILRALRIDSYGVLELCRIFDMPQPGMSHHLKILARAGLLMTRREGNSIFYQREVTNHQNKLEDLTKCLFNAIDDVDLPSDVKVRVEQAHQDRSLNAKEFFKKNADKFRENQDLIAEFAHYRASIQNLLDHDDISPEASVIEIGPGGSPLLNILAQKFKHLIALDNTEAMLNKAKTTLLPKFSKKVEFILGDLNDNSLQDKRADFIVLNMVLHHLASPGQFFKTAAKQLKHNGKLLVIDLCQHHQDWVREVCGDMWLGFEPSDLDKWAKEADFIPDQSAYLGLKNGFQVQARLFQQHKPSP